MVASDSTRRTRNTPTPAAGHKFFELLGMAGSIAPDGRAYHWRENVSTGVAAHDLRQRGKRVTRERFDELRYSPENAGAKLKLAPPAPDSRGWFDIANVWDDGGNELLRIGAALNGVQLHDTDVSVPGGGTELSNRMLDMAGIMLDDMALLGKLVSGLDTKCDPIDSGDSLQLGFMVRRYARTIGTMVEAARELRDAPDVTEGA